MSNSLTSRDAIGLVYQSYNRAKPFIEKKRDRDIRHPEWTKRLLEHFGRPDRHAYNISVTGSKGKGSHSILLAGILEKMGLRVGLFTGPHLVDFMERFRVNGQIMPEAEFIDYITQVHAVLSTYDIPRDQYVGPVGILAVIATLWFQDRETDISIFECGRGAKHDDVNQVIHHGAVISPIFLEHAWELGPTLLDVAEEKAGIISRETQWVVSNHQTDEVLHKIEGRAAKTEAELLVFERDFKLGVSVQKHRSNGDGGLRDFVEVQTEHVRLWLPQGPDYVVENAIVALHAAMRAARDLGRSDFPDVIDLRNIRLPGRLDVVSERPLMVVDGTIHGESGKFIRKWAKEQLASKRVNQFGAILGLPADKDSVGVLEQIKDVADWVIVTRAHNPHLHFNQWVENTVQDMFLKTASTPFVEDALTLCSDWLGENDGILLLGTQSFVGDVLRHFGKDTTSIWNT